MTRKREKREWLSRASKWELKEKLLQQFNHNLLYEQIKQTQQ
jgi:hypothetical protein